MRGDYIISPNNKSKVHTKSNTKDLIRNVAIDLFSKWGSNAVSIRDIAREVGITESTIYSHYKSKDDIMNGIITYLISEFTADPNSPPPPIEQMILAQGAESFIISMASSMMHQLETPHLCKICRLICVELFQSERILNFFKNEYIQVSYDTWDKIFQRMMELGVLPKYDPKILAIEFYDYCIYLFFNTFLLNYNESEIHSVIEMTIQKLTNHIRFMFETLHVKQTKLNKEG